MVIRKAHIVLIGLFTSVLLVMVGCELSRMGKLRKEQAPRYHIVGYASGSASLSIKDAQMLTHINYAFARIDEHGTIYFPDPDAPTYIERLIQLKSQTPYLSILVSIGGWGADYFSDVALTDSSRKAFAQNVGAFVERYDLDGIDLDWEYPGQAGPGIIYREEDKENFTSLLVAIRDRFNEMGATKGRKFPGYILTIAASDSEAYLKHTQMDTVHHVVDYINLMSYDFYTSSSPTTGHHSGLGKSMASKHEGRHVRAGIQRYLDVGVPAEKIVMGVAFYGRGWTGVKNENNGLYQEFEAFKGAYGYSQIKEEMLDKSGYMRFWDEEAKAPYLWNPDSSEFISYEDPESLVHKSTFVQDMALGGIMYWEHRHDEDGALLEVLYYMLK